MRASARIIASRGYVVVAIDHPLTRHCRVSRRARRHPRLATGHHEGAQGSCCRHSVHTHTGSPSSGDQEPSQAALTSERVEMFGHSLGGAAAASAMLVDSRIRAGVDLDGLLFGPVRTGGMSRPFLLMNASPVCGAAKRVDSGTACAAPITRLTSRAPSTSRSATSSFSSRSSCNEPNGGGSFGQLIGNVEGLATLAAERAYIHAFFERFLRAKPQPLLTQTPYPFAGVRLTIGGKP